MYRAMANSKPEGRQGRRALPEDAVEKIEKRTSAVLNTGRMRLRPISSDDVDALHALWNDPDVRRYLWDDRIIPRETVRGDRSRRAPRRSHPTVSDSSRSRCRIESGESDRLLRPSTRRRRARPDRTAVRHSSDSTGAKVSLPRRRVEVLRFGFESCDFERVIAATDTPNQQSVRVLQKLGMTFECRREFHGLDTVFYSMTRSEFLESD